MSQMNSLTTLIKRYVAYVIVCFDLPDQTNRSATLIRSTNRQNAFKAFLGIYAENHRQA